VNKHNIGSDIIVVDIIEDYERPNAIVQRIPYRPGRFNCGIFRFRSEAISERSSHPVRQTSSEVVDAELLSQAIGGGLRFT
jgi:hypothetical protein